MSTLKHHQNLMEKQISTSPDRENNTATCPLMGAGDEHHKAPKKIMIVQKKQKHLQLSAQDPNPKRKQQPPNQRESMNRPNYSHKAPNCKLEANKHN
jgi:hypothetical protein